jgi:SNF2 family DNA or RNA helicase
MITRQNTVEELYSLIKFLRIRPLNDWHTFNEQIAKPVKSGRPGRALKRLHVSSQSPPFCLPLDRTLLRYRLS